MAKAKRSSIFGGKAKANLPELPEHVSVSLSLVYDFLNHRVESVPWLSMT